ncbi:hypothetical protein WJX77_003384 [Trebouxia sp. C0004]
MVGKGPITAVQFYDASDSCPFAAKAWLTLLEKGIKFERHTVNLKDKPKYFTDLYASINPDPTARAKVPLLIDGDKHIVESNLVAEYLDYAYPDLGPKLFPTEPLKLFKVRWFVEMFSEKFSSSLFKLLEANSASAAEEAKHVLDKGLKVLNDFVEQHGSCQDGNLFMGQYSFAEVATTPFVQRASVALLALRGYSIEKAIQQQNLQRLGAWLQAVLDRPSNKETKPDDDSVKSQYAEHLGHFKGHISQ